MGFKDIALLIHPALAVTVIFPLIGTVVYFSWQVRQRRLSAKADGKSKIPPNVGPEHLKLGRWLSNGVVGLALLGMGRPIFFKAFSDPAISGDPIRMGFIIFLYAATIASLVFLNRARTRLWRGVFATLTGMGLVLLGFLEVLLGLDSALVFRRDNEWFISHYYYGMAATLLMVFSLAIYPDIYQDRTQRWRKVHIILNILAVLFFIGQGMTGARDLLEIPLSWQEPHVYKCDFVNFTCPE